MLVSGTGSILQALLDACADPGFGAQIVAVGADRDGTGGVDRAQAAGLPTFVRRLADSPDRAAWDKALTADCAAFEPDLIVLAGFLKLVGADFLAAVRRPHRSTRTRRCCRPSPACTASGTRWRTA